ncbi:MAG: HAD-IA family hydrolase [Candidatus Aenigmarchaeota archaeon]|nr:HAD-IA family hydrolase [Candidatus Aenigmarchaeota archaeon]
MKQKYKIKAIILDMDNTLLDFFGYKIKATKAALRAMQKAGLKIDSKKGYGILFSMYYKYGFESRQIFQKFLEEVTGKVDYRLMAAAMIEYRKARDLALIPYPGIKPTLRKLRKKGIKVIIVSDALNLKAWLRLYTARLENEFDVVITSDMAGGFKSSGKPFKMAVKKLKLKPNQILMVGDSQSRDIIPAKKFGFNTCIAMYGRKHRPEMDVQCLNKFSDILKYV